MKNTLLLFVCISFFGNLHAQSYEYAAFPKKIGIWEYVLYDGFGDFVGPQHQSFSLDTVSQLMTTGSTYYESYYESNKRIFYKTSSDTAYRLIYDFNLTVGDTFRFTPDPNSICTDTMGIVTEDDSVGTYFTKWAGRRTLTIKCANNDFAYWVEGVGKIMGRTDIWYPLVCISVSGMSQLQCVYADTASFPCNSALGQIMEEKPTAGLTIFPNPATNLISLQPPSSAFYQLEIYNELGQLVKQESIVGQQEYAIPLNGFSSGVYLVVLHNKKGIIRQKFLVK